ncbi:MAG TPA: hypothetical protein VNY08_25910 [Bradyrhizobium sp.]|nr:hypothetical protein [Bradyrhizobium sp.]
MRANIILLALGALLVATQASAYDANDPANCVGADWDEAHPLAVARVTAKPRVNFVKSPYDDDFKADTCPAATEACRKKSYLVTGDLVLAARTRDGFTCVAFPSPAGKKPIWTNGWLPSSALTPVAPMAQPSLSEWLGTWDQPHAGIEIKQGGIGGRLHIEGIAAFQGARDVHTGDIDAQVMPDGDTIAFLDDGWLPFATKCDSGCRVRMHRVGRWLLVEDNGDCGGAGVTFTGLYHRK